jgi:hypothetical protein
MITEEMIKTEFISRTVKEGLGRIYDVQESVVAKYYTRGTGRLAAHLSHRPMDFRDEGLDLSVNVRTLTYMRFLDMGARGGASERGYLRVERRERALYNRVVYGVLYRETMPALRYGFTEEMKEKISGDLREADPSPYGAVL